MYLRGFRGMRGFGKLVEDAAGNVYDDGLPDYPPTPGVPSPGTTSDTGPTASSDWINLATQAMKTWGTLQVTKTTTAGDVAKAQYAAASARYQYPYYASGAVYPGIGAASGFNLSALLPIGIVVGVAYFLLK